MIKIQQTFMLSGHIIAAYRFVLTNTQTLTLLSHPHILENYGAILKVKDLQKMTHSCNVAGWKSPINRTLDRSAGDGTLHLLQLCKHYGKFNDNQLLKTARAVLLASLNSQSRCHLLWHENFLTPYWNKKKKLLGWGMRYISVCKVTGDLYHWQVG